MRRPNGFSMIEVTVTVMIGILLTDMAIRNVAPVQNAVAVSSSVHTMQSLVARTRAHAIERGAIARLEIDMVEDRASILVGEDVLETIGFASMGVDIRSEHSLVRLCMNPSGFGETGCNSFSDDVVVDLVRGEKASSLLFGPLGRVVKL